MRLFRQFLENFFGSKDVHQRSFGLRRQLGPMSDGQLHMRERGKICFGGTMAELDARPDILDAHLSL